MPDPEPRFVSIARSILKEGKWPREAISSISFENAFEVLVDLSSMRLLADGVPRRTILPESSWDELDENPLGTIVGAQSNKQKG